MNVLADTDRVNEGVDLLSSATSKAATSVGSLSKWSAVARLGDTETKANGDTWVKVRATIDGSAVQGWLPELLLEPMAQEAPPPLDSGFKTNVTKGMRPVPEGIHFVDQPVTYADGRRSFVAIPDGYEQAAIGDDDFAALADEFNIDEALVRAVIDVESGESGFLLEEPPPARPKILFEAQWFYKLTPKPVSKTRPDLASKKWNRSLYKGGSAEWDRLLDAAAFDTNPALQSASFGLGQVMGFNYAIAGCASVEEFVVQAFAGEYWQARHMMNFMRSKNLLAKLREQDWSGFAVIYNGAGYRQNKYDTKLKSAHERAIKSGR